MAYYNPAIYNPTIPNQYGQMDRINYSNQMYGQPVMQSYQPQMINNSPNISQNNNQSFPIRVRSVTSIKEAEAVIPELDCTLDVFVNIPMGEIYTKQLNIMNGSAIFNTYILKPQNNTPITSEKTEQASNNSETKEFVTKDEYKTLLDKIDELDFKILEIQEIEDKKQPKAAQTNDKTTTRGTKQ